MFHLSSKSSLRFWGEEALKTKSTYHGFHHTTASEAAPVKAFNDIRLGTNSGRISVSVLPLTQHIAGQAEELLPKFESYLEDRDFVSIGNYESATIKGVQSPPKLSFRAPSI